jgi:NADH-quinone oxidoreductase subunit C
VQVEEVQKSMTVVLAGQEIANLVTARFPEAVIEFDNQAAVVKSEYLLKVADLLKNSPELAFSYLNDITAVDYYDYFEVVYRLTSLEHNKSLGLKVRCSGREDLKMPSVTSLWKGAAFMEREIYDLMGINFSGHANLKRIFLWEGFSGHPLRKDYLQEIKQE